MRSVSSPTTVTHLAGHSISAVIAVYNQAVGITPWAHTLYSFDVGQLQFNVVDQALFVVTIRYELLLRDIYISKTILSATLILVQDWRVLLRWVKSFVVGSSG